MYAESGVGNTTMQGCGNSGIRKMPPAGGRRGHRGRGREHMAVKRRVGLIGAGFISHIHAEIIARTEGARLAAVIDPARGAAERLARQWGDSDTRVFERLEEAIEAGAMDAAHVLVPPLLHEKIATALLDAGIPTLLEKPMTVDSTSSNTLAELAETKGVTLAVNQNFIHHPAFLGIKKLIREGTLGGLRTISCQYNVPLRQLAGRQFGHWMFHHPANILLEQAVHPLSQICNLMGDAARVKAMASKPEEISPKVPFHRHWAVSLECDGGLAQLNFAVGQSYPFWQVAAVCDDGVAVADILANRTYTFRRTKWLEFYDAFLSGRATAREIAFESWRNAANYVLSTIRLKPRSDGFTLSMNNSIRDFHAALDEKRPPESDARFGAALVGLCERIADDAGIDRTPLKTPKLKTRGKYDVAIIGGTGFIGVHTVRRFLDAGHRVGVMARNTTNLAPVFYDRRVTVIRGDVTRREDVEKLVKNARIVVNLAHGGGGADWEAIRRALVGSAETVAECCLEHGVERLIHVGSSAALYLGDKDAVIRGADGVDPEYEKRADYARAKAEADNLMLRLHHERGLPVCLLRPAIVTGEGGLALHSGLGFYNNEQYCNGWDRGDHPLPFVLVEDVAEAIYLASQKDIAIGRSYNLAGDYRPDARTYFGDLAYAMGRPLRFCGQSPAMLQAMEIGKWIVKRIGGRDVPFPSWRDLKSRGMVAHIDCSDIKEDLGWQPVGERDRFLRRGVEVYGDGG